MTAKMIAGGSADGMVKAIHNRIHAECAERGEVWCGHWGHKSRKPGRVCAQCIHQHVCWVRFWRTMGVRNPEREM